MSKTQNKKLKYLILREETYFLGYKRIQQDD